MNLFTESPCADRSVSLARPDDDDDDDGRADGVVGRVVLGSFMFSRGKELEHWNRMTANVDEQIVQWHSLL